jgi:hypothetical protein
MKSITLVEMGIRSHHNAYVSLFAGGFLGLESQAICMIRSVTRIKEWENANYPVEAYRHAERKIPGHPGSVMIL